MTIDEITVAFQTHLTGYKHGLVIQKALLSASADNDDALAARRCLSLLESTELRSILLALYPEYKISSTDLNNSNSISEIANTLAPFIKTTKRAITELEATFPLETVDLLRDYLVKESPRYYIAVNIFIVVSMILIEAGEI
jgi:hypothetical protein